MVRRSDKATRSKSLTHAVRRDDAAAAEEELEGEAVHKVLFAEEAEVSRRREQRRRELVDQHENPRKPTPLLEVNVNVHPEKQSKSLHRLMNHSETVEEQWTIRFIPAGSETTSRQQEGARPKQPSKETILPERQRQDAARRDAGNAIDAAGTSNAATWFSSPLIHRDLRLPRPPIKQRKRLNIAAVPSIPGKAVGSKLQK